VVLGDREYGRRSAPRVAAGCACPFSRDRRCQPHAIQIGQVGWPAGRRSARRPRGHSWCGLACLSPPSHPALRRTQTRPTREGQQRGSHGGGFFFLGLACSTTPDHTEATSGVCTTSGAAQRGRPDDRRADSATPPRLGADTWSSMLPSVVRRRASLTNTARFAQALGRAEPVRTRQRREGRPRRALVGVVDATPDRQNPCRHAARPAALRKGVLPGG